MTPEGVQHCVALGASLKRAPDYVLCSTALRTRQTYERVCEGLEHDIPVTFDKTLYYGGVGAIYELIKDAPNDADSLLVISHNPDTPMLLRFLAQEGSHPDLAMLGMQYPPATLSVLSCPIAQWTDLMPGQNPLIKSLGKQDVL